ncbi:MAG: hypothetical protein H6713_27560 [Myxococcales bacterium]|nr:hypothetical protein [Myxococcales bacterium]MCB9753716.1 hypothetical protein [Myxococcales bacterium]
MTICLGGDLTGGEFARVEPNVREIIGEQNGKHGVLWDLRQVRRCDLSARRSMQKLQSEIAERKLRTAYVASRPRIRGVALWVVHTSGDKLARPFANHDQAVDWLDTSRGRMEEIIHRAKEIVSFGERKGARP